jgi:flavin-dependent dehydrogenase
LTAHFRGVDAPAGTVELYLVEGGYCGVSPVEEGLTNVCLLVAARRLREVGTPERLLTALGEESPALRERLSGAERVTERFLATAGLCYRTAALRPALVPRLGDAAGLIAPLTGDGMAMALRAAELASPLALAYLEGRLREADYADRYAAAWNREFGGRRRWGGVLQCLLERPGAVDLLLAWIRRAPRLGQFLAQRTRGRLT